MYDADAAMVIFTQRVHENPEKGWTYTADTQGGELRPPGEEDTIKFLKSSGNQPR